MFRKPYLLLSFLLAGSVLLPAGAAADDDPPASRLITVSVEDPDGSPLQDVRLSLMDAENPEEEVESYTTGNGPFEIMLQDGSHSYVLRETAVPDGYYYLEDVVIADEDNQITLVNPRIELSVGIHDPFVYKEPMDYPLQILDMNGQIAAGVLTEESGRPAVADAAGFNAREQYILYMETKM